MEEPNDTVGSGVVGVVGTAEEPLGVALDADVATGVDAEMGVPVRDERAEERSMLVGVLSGMMGVVGIEISGVEARREDRIDSTPVSEDDEAGLEALDGVGVATEPLAVKGMLGSGVRTEERSLPALETRLVTSEMREPRALVIGRGISSLVVGAGVTPGVKTPVADPLSPVAVGIAPLMDEVTGGISVPVPA